MQTKVNDLNGIQQLIQTYRPWFDDSYQDLSILRALTLAFPENGDLTAKTIDVRDGNVVSCNGTARDNTVLLNTQDQLRQTDGVSELKVQEIRGKTPEQFTMEFHWGYGGGNEN
jgi:hypothetical protein